MILPEWLEIVIRVVGILYTVVTLVLLIVLRIRAIKRRRANGENVSILDAFKEVSEYAIRLIMQKEVAYERLTLGTNAKAGEFKLESVLNGIRDKCLELSYPYIREDWEVFVDNQVKLINFNRDYAEVQSSEQEKKFKFIGAKKNESQSDL